MNGFSSPPIQGSKTKTTVGKKTLLKLHEKETLRKNQTSNGTNPFLGVYRIGTLDVFVSPTINTMPQKH